MGKHDVQQVCLNGHQITDRYLTKPEFRKEFCDKCGEQTIYKCQECGQNIPGDYIVDGVIFFGGSTPIPDFCKKCGTPFPWYKRKSQLEQTISHEGEKSLELISHICSRFHLVAKQIRQRHNNRGTLDIKDEYDVQDLIHALLRLFFDDIRPEEWTPSYAGGSSRVDFLLKYEGIIIEIKKTRKGLGPVQLGEQLIIDKTKYHTHPDCKTLFCFVYDPDGYISNSQGIENDLSVEEEDFCVKICITPKGY